LKPTPIRMAVLLALALGTTGASAAEETQPVDLAPTSTFRVEVDGAEVRAAATYVAGETGLLILGSGLRFPILVVTEDQTIRYVPDENVLRDEEGNVRMKGSPTDPVCNYQVSAGQIIFQAEGHKVRLSPRPPLVGPQTLEAIIQHNPDYQTRIAGYKPETTAVEFLRGYPRKTEIQIYFGSWCSVCEAWVPRLVKALQSAGNASLQTQFIALPKNFISDVKARSKGIDGVPTIILLQDGKEVGRLSGRPESGTIEAALVRVLKTATT